MTFSQPLRRSMLPAALFAAGVALAPQHASAQAATYCTGLLMADGVYTTRTLSGSTSRMNYFLRMHASPKKTVFATIQFNPNQSSGEFSDKLSRNLTMAQFESVTLKLGTQTLNNPSWQGAISVEDAARAIHVTCR